ncbi:MAG TPA: SurA N-terminal domain-containing protein [Candidatus Acidoferrales bacterium]|nr:SurA N-terminal domain-containing protein [Candidatus Acidoferrales bacterium]
MSESLHRWRGLSCLALLSIFALLCGCTGCGQGGSAQDVMAKVNGYKVLRSEVDKSYNMQIAGSPQKPTAAEEETLRLNILDQIIGVQLHLQQAEKLGVVATDDEVDTKFTQMKAPYTSEEFQKKLKDQGLTEADAKQEIRRNLTIEKLLNKEIASKVNITDGDIQNYYNQHKAEFNLIEPRYFMASIQVYVRPPGQPAGDKGQTEAQARQKIQMIYNRLESGEDFATVAAQWSEDADTAHNGGEMGPVPESQLKNTDPATRDAVLKLKPGQYSNIIPMVNPETRQPVGYRIVKLIGKEAAGQRDLNDPAVQQWIRNQLRTQREQLLRAAYDEVLRDKAEIHNYYAENVLKNTASVK